MSRKSYLFLALLLVMSLALAACGGTDNAANQNTANEANAVPEAMDDPEPELIAEAGESILERVKANGTLVCGGRTSLLGFGYLDADGNTIGFDIDLCHAVAAAVLGDADAVEIVPLDASDRGPVFRPQKLTYFHEMLHGPQVEMHNGVTSQPLCSMMAKDS